MAERTITTKLAIAGEAEYKRKLQDINAQLAAQQSALKLTQAEHQNSANTMEALIAKGQALEAVQAALAEKQELIAERLKVATAKLAEYQEAIQTTKERQEENSAALSAMDEATQKAGTQWADYAQKIETAEKQLEKMSGTSEETAERKRQLQEKIEDLRASMEQLERETVGDVQAAGKLVQTSRSLEDELKLQEAYADAAQRGIYNLEKSQNSAAVQAAKLKSEIQLNNEYLKEAEESSDGCATSIDRFGKRVEGSTDGLVAMSDALAAAGLVTALKKMADLMWDCCEASMAMESAITGVYKTVDGTPEQLAEISDGIKAMSTQLPTAATEIAAVAETAGQLGIQTENILSFTRVMVDLGESTNLSAEEGASALAKLANITGMSADNYERLGSVIVALGNNFATTESDIVSMATRLSATGSLTGLTEAQIMALAAAMSSMGIEAEAGGSAVSKLLKQFETMVATGSEELAQFAAIAGMSEEEFSAAWGKDAVSALTAFIQGLGRIDAAGGSSVAALEALGITETRLSNAVLSLASSGDLLTTAVTLANQAWAENTALAEEAAKRYETAESKLAMLSNSAYNFQAAVGDVLNEALVPMYEVGTQAFAWMTDVAEEAPGVVAAVAAMTTAVGGLTAGVMALGAAKKALAADGFLAAAIGAVTNPAFLAVAGIAALTAGVVAFAAAANDAADATDEFRASLEESRTAFEENVAAVQTNAEDMLALANAIITLADAEDLTQFQEAALLDMITQLNQAVPGLSLAYDEQTGALNLTADAVRNLVAAEADRQVQAEAVAQYNALLTQQAAIAEELRVAHEDLEKARALNKAAAEDGIHYNTELAQAQGEAAKTVWELEDRYEALQEELDFLQEEYGDLTSTTEETGDAAGDTAQQIEGLTAASEDLTDTTKSLVDAEDMLTTALDEQAKSGSLSLDTALKLIDAGYAAALSIDEESNAVVFNKEKYIELTEAKLEEQIRSLSADRKSIIDGLNDEAQAALEAANANYDFAISELQVDKAIVGQVASCDAQIAALQKLKDNLGSYTYESQNAARTTASTSKQIQTQAEKDLAAYKDLKATLDHEKAMDLVSERDYYAKLKEYRDQYLTDDSNLDEYRKITEEIYKYDQQLAEDEDKLWEEQTEALVSALEDRISAILDKQDEMARNLAEYGDLFTVEDDQMALESIQAQIDALNQYEDALTSLRERGISDSLMDQVLGMDVDEATQYANLLLNQSNEDWEQYLALWEEKQQRSQEIAQNYYQSELDVLQTEFDEKLADGLDGLKDTSFQAGIDTMEGLLEGLASQEDAVYAKAESIANQIAATIRSALDMHSPSQVGKEIGSNFVGSIGLGAEEEAPTMAAMTAAAVPTQMVEAATPSRGEMVNTVGNMMAQTVNAMGLMANNQNARYVIELTMNVDGKQFYRETIEDLRAVEKSTPEVKDDV